MHPFIRSSIPLAAHYIRNLFLRNLTQISMYYRVSFVTKMECKEQGIHLEVVLSSIVASRIVEELNGVDEIEGGKAFQGALAGVLVGTALSLGVSTVKATFVAAVVAAFFALIPILGGVDLEDELEGEGMMRLRPANLACLCSHFCLPVLMRHQS